MFKRNQKVIYNGNKHKTCPYFYPEKGTIGRFQYLVDEHDDIAYVEFPVGSIGTTDLVMVYTKDIKTVEEEDESTT